MNFAIVAYPLSAGYRERFEAAVGDRPEYLPLQELRRLSLPRSLRALLAIRGKVCYMPIEDEASEALLPILGLVAAAGGASRLVVVRHDLSQEIVPKARAWWAALGLAGASARNLWAAAAARRELDRLESLPRQGATVGIGQRVLYLNSNLWFGVKAGGSVGHVAGVVNAFGRAGYAVDLWSATDPVMIHPPARTSRLRPHAAFGLPLELNYYAFQRRMVPQVRREASVRYAFLYQRMSVANFAGVVLSRLLRIPLVIEYNGSEVWIARKWGRPLRFERLAALAETISLRHAHVIVTVSEVLHDDLVARGVDQKRVVWHPNGVDADVFDPERFTSDARSALRSEHGLAPDDVIVAFVGTFGRWHGAEILARAVRTLAESDLNWLRQWQVRFVFVGDGVRMPDVRRELDVPGIRAFVRFTGLVPQESTAAFLAASDILVAPHVPNEDGTPFFGSPTKLFEYMAMGKAILASDLDQIGAVIHPALRAGAPPTRGPREDAAEVGMVTVPGDASDIGRGLRFLVEYPDWRARLGANARRAALARYTWDHHVAAILDRVISLARGASLP